eukprot:m.142507 g.142507  ORF g.142507 m.142507 type:complete len:57 (-) comp24184_c1_seq25:111-281(-)
MGLVAGGVEVMVSSTQHDACLVVLVVMADDDHDDHDDHHDGDHLDVAAGPHLGRGG